MSASENGIREAVTYLRREIDKLWVNKASKGDLEHVREDIIEIKAEIVKIREIIEKRREDRQKEQKEQANERRSNRRWFIGTTFTAISIVIAAMAILIQLLGNGATP